MSVGFKKFCSSGTFIVTYLILTKEKLSLSAILRVIPWASSWCSKLGTRLWSTDNLKLGYKQGQCSHTHSIKLSSSGHQADRGNAALANAAYMYIFDVFDILDIHVMVSRQLSKQGIHWPVSHDHIMGSGFEPIEVTRFCKVDHWPSTGFNIRSQAQLRLNFFTRVRLFGRYTNVFRSFYFV